MGRIRTIKPEFFKHSGLFDAERETGLPLRVAYAGIWTCCDREGRFKWRPRELKLDVLPYDDCDFSRVLDVLHARGFLIKYTSGTEHFGAILSWKGHQFINNKEPQSVIPEPPKNELFDASITRGIHLEDPSETRGVKEGEGNVDGKELKPSQEKAKRTKDPNCKTALRKKKHGEFKDAIKAYWIHTNGDLEMPWAEAEGMQLDLWLKASPNATLQDFRRMLYNRSLSQVNQTERPSKWIRNVTDFWKPVDRFNKPPERANSNGKGHSNLAALNESLAEDGYHASYQDGPDGDGDPALNDGGQLDLKTLLAQVGEGKA